MIRLSLHPLPASETSAFNKIPERENEGALQRPARRAAEAHNAFSRKGRAPLPPGAFSAPGPGSVSAAYAECACGATAEACASARRARPWRPAR